MKARRVRALAAAVAQIMALVGLGGCSSSGTLSSVASAASSDARLFEPIAAVLTHPRCLNCHTVSDYPRQGNDRHRHLFLVARGSDDRGVPGGRCGQCHQAQNQAASGVPGAPNWRLAPSAMAWEAGPGEAMDDSALCRRLLDRSRNGGRDLAALEQHLGAEPLVRWAWRPGDDSRGASREVPPIGHAQFVQAFRAWTAAGAPCPDRK
jgi:hypothetical protein